MDDYTKETVIIVHGTWAAPEPDKTRWYQPVEVGGVAEGFVTKLNKALQERGSVARCWAHCNDGHSIFHWSRGENSWIARTHAASALADYVNHLQQEGWLYHIVAHSHGGNVVLEALPQTTTLPRSDGRLGKIVTLGTPFMNTLSPIRKRAERRANLLKKIGWVFFWYFAAAYSFMAVVLIQASSLSTVLSLFLTILVVIGFIVLVLFVWRTRRAAGDGIQSVPVGVSGAIQPQRTLLAINCPTDEAWQVLHHLPTIQNPLAVRLNLFAYLVSSMQSHILQIEDVARIRGARSFRDIGTGAKVVAAFLDFCAVAGTLALPALLLPSLFGPPEGVLHLSGDDRARERFEMLNLLMMFMLPISATLLALALRPVLGAAFYSAYWSPFRWCAHRLRSFAIIGSALATYLVRRWSWPVFLRIVMGLENYGLSPPAVTQCPSDVGPQFAKFENMPKGAEQRALGQRSAWIAQHLGGVSETFAKLAVTAADLTSLLRTIEADQTLVHAAYYTDDECIARIADWIAGKG
jgi:hypothetical protein